jgi:hypothetical protein
MLHFKNSIFAARGHHLTIGTPIDRVDLVRVARQVRVQPLLLQVPDLEGGVGAAADKQSTVRREADLVHGLHVTSERGQKPLQRTKYMVYIQFLSLIFHFFLGNSNPKQKIRKYKQKKN